jgi:sugar lactone lactonase YvrE
MQKNKLFKLAASAIVSVFLALAPNAAFAANSATKISTTPYPVGIYLDPAGNVYIADAVGARLVVYPHGTNSVNLFGHTFTGGVESTFTLPAGSAAPKGVAIDPVSGALFYSEFSGKIWAISHKPVTLFGTVIDQAHIDTFVQVATIPGAKGAITFDTSGNLFAAGEDSGAIQVLPRVASIFGNLYAVNLPTQLVQSGQFVSAGNFLADLAFDKDGNLFVTAMFGPGSGVWVLTAGDAALFGHSVDNSAFYSLTDGSDISHPCGIDTDAAGRVYVGDWGQNKVYELSKNSENVFDVPLTANVASSIPSFNGLANQGIAVRPNGAVLYSGAMDGTYQLINTSDAWVNADTTDEVTTLANTGVNLQLIFSTGAILSIAGFLLIRRSAK